MQGSPDDLDQRVRHTRISIVEALVRLALDRRYDQIKTSDLIAAAGVGRSTFYEHFRSKDEVLLTAMEPLLLPIANAAAGRGAKAHLRAMLDHAWHQRALGRVVLDSRAAVRLQRKLAAMIEARLEENESRLVPLAMLAMSAAASQLSMLRMWIGGEGSCSSDALARQMIAFSALLSPEVI
jgi:AcrR family transcriptional regulator